MHGIVCWLINHSDVLNTELNLCTFSVPQIEIFPIMLELTEKEERKRFQ